jgi:hypothetical protein
MADDTQVDIRFSASVDGALEGIEQVRAGLDGLTEPVRNLDGNLAKLKSTFAGSLPAGQLDAAAGSLTKVGQAAAQSRSEVKELGSEIKLLQLGLSEKKVLFDAEAKQFQITQDQKFSLLEQETEREYGAERDLYERKLQLSNLSAEARDNLNKKLEMLDAKHNIDMLKLDEQAIAAQQAQWTEYLSTVTSAFNSQLRGLLEGTTTWNKAMKKMFEDLTIKFIEMAEQMVVKWLAGEIAKTTATTTGAAARAAAEESAASAGILGMVANAMKAIMTDAGQAFAGVFAFLAPTMGPAAAGPAAAAEASVSAAAIFDAGTDYVVRGGLAMIHPGETIIPPAQGSGPFTGTGMGGGATTISPSINITAMDSRSVARFFNDNAHHMVRALQRGLKGGGRLPVRSSMR